VLSVTRLLPMTSCFNAVRDLAIKTITTIFLLTTTVFADGPHATVKIDNLTILECTHILNQYTPFRVTAETPLEHLLPKNHHLDLMSITSDTTLPTVLAIVDQDTDYYATVTNNCVHILYKATNLLLNHKFTDFAVTGDMADVILALRKEIPTLILFYPFHIGWKHLNGPNPYIPPTAYEHQTYGGQTMSFHLTNITARDVLTQAAMSQTNRMYWIATYGNDVNVSYYSEKDNMGAKTIQNHDPEIIERIHHAQEEPKQNQEPPPKQ
jgi:hypothetical protein